MKEYSKAITPTRERTARPIRVASFFFVVLLPGKSSACSSAGVRGCAPRVPHVRCSRHCLQGCGDVPRVLPVDCTAPAQARASASSMDANATDEGAHTLHARALCHASVTHAPANAAHRPAHMCVCCTQRGSVGLWGSRRDSHGALAIAPPSMRPDTLCSTPTCSPPSSPPCSPPSSLRSTPTRSPLPPL